MIAPFWDLHVLSGGLHPFGESYERDANILNREPNFAPLQASMQPHAVNLLSAMMLKDAAERPTMAAVLAHPLWWGPEQQLQLLVDVSDRSVHVSLLLSSPLLSSPLLSSPLLSSRGREGGREGEARGSESYAAMMMMKRPII
jgi:hypothetical protein